MSNSGNAFVQGQKAVAAMGTTYAMGTFNDNFFKQAAVLMAGAAGLETLQGIATVLFALPFVLCSAWAGWLADRFPKHRIVVWSKGLELAAMLAGLWALISLSWAGIIFVIFLMGLQSAFFSPALNGSIPEQFPQDRVPRVNALLKLFTTATMLLGIALGGVFLGLTPPRVLVDFLPAGADAFGRLAVGAGAVLVSALGLAMALFIPGSRRIAADVSFPFTGPVDSVRDVLAIGKQRPELFLVLLGEAFFYTVSSFVVLCIANLGVRQLRLSYELTSLMSVGLMIGVSIGALLAGRNSRVNWKRSAPSAGAGIGIGLILSACAVFLPESMSLLWLLIVLTMTGVCGGLYLIPLVSAIQIMPDSHEKGRILGVSNFLSFSGIILSGLVFSGIGHVRPTVLLAGAGCVCLLFIMLLLRSMRGHDPSSVRRSLLGVFLRAVMSLRYRVQVKGEDALQGEGPILFLPNHPALVDPLLVYSRIADFRPRPLSDERRMQGLGGAFAKALINPICIPDIMKDRAAGRAGVLRGLEEMEKALGNGTSILLYPAGKIYRSESESIGGTSAVSSLLSHMPDVRVVLVRTTGLWGSAFSHASGRPPRFALELLRGAAMLLVNGIFFMPRREVTIEFVETPELPRHAEKRVLNRWLEDFYNVAQRPATLVPHFFWQGGTSTLAAALNKGERRADVSGVPELVRQGVYAFIREAAGLPDDEPLSDEMTLAGDCGLDSLGLMALAMAIEQESGTPVADLESLVTVGDCLLAAMGLFQTEEFTVPDAWFAKGDVRPLALPGTSRTILSAFRDLVSASPGELLLAERSVLYSRRKVFIAASAMAGRVHRLEGKRVGILLPAAPGAVIAWLACLMAGKEPVFLNWTVGDRNLRHCLELAQVRDVLTSSRLLERLGRQGLDYESLPARWIALEGLAKEISTGGKILALLRSLFPTFGVRGTEEDIAAILFTSGSESMPKAVPLTHRNLLTNAVDIMDALGVTSDNSILAMLPPFHSFGLMVDCVLPLAMGIRAAYHPNPTEGANLAKLVETYKLTLLATPPTFLRPMLEHGSPEQLASLRFAFVGAEKCPESLYRDFAMTCPRASLCEGYGITECSPAVAVNRPGKVKDGTIGMLLPSVTAAIVREREGGKPERVETGETGMLLVRGPSIFSGYIGDAPSPFVTFEEEQWYRTGDLVSMDDEGRLTFRGRLKRFVKIGGEMISLPQIEEALLEIYSSRAEPSHTGPILAVEAGAEDEKVRIVLFTPLSLTAGEVNAKLRGAGLSALYAVHRVVHLESLPILGSGKTDYQSLKKMLKMEYI